MTSTARKMNVDLCRNVGTKTMNFHLNRHMAVVFLHKVGSGYNDIMEEEGYFPPTVSWLNYEGQKVKLYENPDLGNYDLASWEIGSWEINSGPLEPCVLPFWERRLEDFQRTGDPFMLEVKPVALPEKTVELIRILRLLGV